MKKNKGKEIVGIKLLTSHGRIVRFQVEDEYEDMLISLLKNNAIAFDQGVKFSKIKKKIFEMKFSNEDLAEEMRQAWK